MHDDRPIPGPTLCRCGNDNADRLTPLTKLNPVGRNSRYHLEPIQLVGYRCEACLRHYDTREAMVMVMRQLDKEEREACV